MKHLNNWLYVAAPFCFVVLVMAFVTTSTVLSSFTSNSATVINSDLETSGKFAVFAASGIHNVGMTTLVGNVGTYPVTTQLGFKDSPSRVTILRGKNYHGNAVSIQVARDINTLASLVNSESPVTAISSKLTGTLKPGAYDSTEAIFALEETLELDGENNPNSVFVFKTATDFVTDPSSKVVLKNGAQACNVYWLIGGNATLGEGSHVVGNIITFLNANLKAGASVNGSVFARKGNVLLDSNIITRAECEMM